MNGLLEQLATRSLDSMPLAIRPRQLSRFESMSPTQTEMGDVLSFESPATFAERDSAQYDRPMQPIQAPTGSIEQPRLEHYSTPDMAASPMTEKRPSDWGRTTDVPPLLPNILSQTSSDGRAEALTRRLDQLDRQLQRFADRDETSGPSTEPVPSLTVEPVESISRRETHHHHQHRTENNYHSQSIEQATEQPVIIPQLKSYVSRERTAPSIVAENKPIGQRQIEAPGAVPHIVRPRIEAKHLIPPPQVTVKPIVPALPVEASRRAERPGSLPQIVVERSLSSESASHTVTVTIGRIEVRAPQKPAAPAIDKLKRPAARIMSLDDYMRRRAGGAG